MKSQMLTRNENGAQVRRRSLTHKNMGQNWVRYSHQSGVQSKTEKPKGVGSRLEKRAVK